MKNILFILPILFIIGCTSNEKIYQIIEDDIKTSIPNHWTYVPDNFIIVDSFMSSVYDTEQYIKLQEEKKSYDSIFIADSIGKEEAIAAGGINLYPDDYFSITRFGMSAQGVKEISNKILSQMNDLKNKYVPHLIGKAVFHNYKCTTDFGDSTYLSMYVLDDKYNIVSKKEYSKMNDYERDILNIATKTLKSQ